MISPAGTPRPLRTITRPDVLRVLDGVLARGRPIMANLLLAHIKRLFNWTIERGLIQNLTRAQGATAESEAGARARPPS